MKRASKVMMVVWGCVMAVAVMAQNKIDEERMERDIEIAENVLGTLIKQHLDQKRAFFPMEVEGSYAQGYGVTFRIPSQMFGSTIWATEDFRGPAVVYSYGNNGQEEDFERDTERRIQGVARTKSTARDKRQTNSDSAKLAYDQKLIESAKSFLADYGDMITQLAPDEKVIVTNRNAGQRIWVGSFANGLKQSYLSVEATKGDVTAYKQGKLSKEQFNSKLRIINSEKEEEMHADRELLSSIFNRLYRPDLSKSYYTNESIYYESLKDFGVIYYMRVYSSNQDDNNSYSMPTLKLQDLSQDERDNKVKELYPAFERTLKEDILEYGRTVKSLDSDESLIFNVTLTKCVECNIPTFVEYTIKAAVLSEYSTGKLTKEAALARFTTKKGPNQ